MPCSKTKSHQLRWGFSTLEKKTLDWSVTRALWVVVSACPQLFLQSIIPWRLPPTSLLLRGLEYGRCPYLIGIKQVWGYNRHYKIKSQYLQIGLRYFQIEKSRAGLVKRSVRFKELIPRPLPSCTHAPDPVSESWESKKGPAESSQFERDTHFYWTDGQAEVKDALTDWVHLGQKCSWARPQSAPMKW